MFRMMNASLLVCWAEMSLLRPRRPLWMVIAAVSWQCKASASILSFHRSALPSVVCRWYPMYFPASLRSSGCQVAMPVLCMAGVPLRFSPALAFSFPRRSPRLFPRLMEWPEIAANFFSVILRGVIPFSPFRKVAVSSARPRSFTVLWVPCSAPGIFVPRRGPRRGPGLCLLSRGLQHARRPRLARKFAFGARVALNHSDSLRNRSQRNRSQRVPVLNWTSYIFWIIKIGAAGRARRGVTGRARRANSLGAKMKLSELAGRFSGFWKNQAGASACWDHCSKTALCF